MAENTAGLPKIVGEWGFSAVVEADGMNILLDTGQGSGILNNAELLGVDLSKIDKIVISHAHFDHTGGLLQALSVIGKEVEVIAAPDLWDGKYRYREGQEPVYIGIPYARDELEALGARFTLTQEPVTISENIMTTGEVPLLTDFEQVGEKHLLSKVGDDYQRDTFPDDRALIVKTDVGLAVILGCAHRCLINTLYHAQKLTGVDEIHTIVGGCHLFSSSDDIVMKTIEALKELDVQRIGVSHCTGLKASAIMAEELGDRFFFNNAGSKINVPEMN
jgi:7,8-dihydropterin-6-yl-methyl-4-(beta-D-ribofuranosyl)aminobenzene 5'-phosphate synthase